MIRRQLSMIPQMILQMPKGLLSNASIPKLHRDSKIRGHWQRKGSCIAVQHAGIRFKDATATPA